MKIDPPEAELFKDFNRFYLRSIHRLTFDANR